MDTLLNLGAIQIIILILSLVGVGFLMYYMYNHIQELSEKIEKMDNKILNDRDTNLGVEEDNDDIFNEILDEINEDSLEEDAEEDEDKEENFEGEKIEEFGEDMFYNEPEQENKIVELQEETGCIQILKTGKNLGNKCNKKTLENSMYCKIHNKYME